LFLEIGRTEFGILTEAQASVVKRLRRKPQKGKKQEISAAE